MDVGREDLLLVGFLVAAAAPFAMGQLQGDTGSGDVPCDDGLVREVEGNLSLKYNDTVRCDCVPQEDTSLDVPSEVENRSSLQVALRCQRSNGETQIFNVWQTQQPDGQR